MLYYGIFIVRNMSVTRHEFDVGDVGMDSVYKNNKYKKNLY